MFTKNSPKILVVDDEPDVVASFQSYFGRRGFSVSTTGSGKEALFMIKALQPDLVLLDLTLSEMNGRAVLKTLREIDQKTKVVVISGHIQGAIPEEDGLEDFGITAYINKPIDLEELENMIRDILVESFSVQGFNEENFLKLDEQCIYQRVHQLKNLLGNMKNECRIFVLNKKDGIYNSKTEQEIIEAQEKILFNVIKIVDQAIVVLDSCAEKSSS